MKSFDEKDIIVLSERLHPELKQYEMIVDIIKDDKFKGNVYTEVGVFNIGNKINKFLEKEGLSDNEVEEEILNIFKNLDMFSLWPIYNYYYLIESIYQINQNRNTNDKIFLYPLDVIFSWDSIKCNEQYSMFLKMFEPQNNFPPVIDRNAIMGKHFIRAYKIAKKFNPNKIKALVILNTYHGYTRIPKYLQNPTEPFTYSTAEYIYKTFPNSTKGVLINGYSFSSISKFVAGGKWDAAFRITGNKNIGFDMKDTPFGTTQFDMYNFGGNSYEKVNFEYLFDGFVFYEPIENYEIAIGIPNLFSEPTFVEEFYRRTAIEENITIDEAKSSSRIKESIKTFNVLTKEKLQDNADRNQVIKDLDNAINKWIIK